MKKIALLIFVISALIACREGIVEFPEDSSKGTIYIDSEPRGARIYLNNTFISKFTPDSIINLDPGEYSITLREFGYLDTTVVVNLNENIVPYVNVTLIPY